MRYSSPSVSAELAAEPIFGRSIAFPCAGVRPLANAIRAVRAKIIHGRRLVLSRPETEERVCMFELDHAERLKFNGQTVGDQSVSDA
jgi:hypothetical protein